VIDIGPTTNGSRRTFRVNAATIAAVASVLGILVYVGGFISGYMLMRQNLTDLQTKVDGMQVRLDSVLDRLTHVEADAHYTAQGIADLKLLRAGTNR
jgi:cell division protein FtsX